MVAERDINKPYSNQPGRHYHHGFPKDMQTFSLVLRSELRTVSHRYRAQSALVQNLYLHAICWPSQLQMLLKIFGKSIAVFRLDCPSHDIRPASNKQQTARKQTTAFQYAKITSPTPTNPARDWW
jgi:hypothetical protein